jgi:putative ABC transport system permease protein
VFAFALKTLLSDRGKLLTGLAGVVFSLVLVNVQGGLFLGLMRKASVLIDHCDADLWVGHRQIENIDFAHDIPEGWINRLRGLEGVERVEPYLVGKGVATLRDGGFEDVWVIGSDPATMMGTGWSFVAGSADDLRRPYAVSFDEIDAPPPICSPRWRPLAGFATFPLDTVHTFSSKPAAAPTSTSCSPRSAHRSRMLPFINPTISQACRRITG